jgi:digeranylgeranylglycerophospholipid reductase
MPAVDVLVVGAGPAGCVAAWEAAAAGAGRVLLIERDRAIGSPVRCAEGVGTDGLREFLDPDGAPWVSRHITTIIFVSPDDTEVRLPAGDIGYVLDRTRFEPELAERASRAGAAIRISTEAVGLERADGPGGGRWRVRLRGPGGEETVTARIVIGADGVETMVGRWAGLETRVAARDMESCAQYVVGNIQFDPDAIYLHFGPSVSPGGYAWIFPKGEGVANVGLGILARRGDGRTVRQYLDDYVARHFPHGTVTGFTVGGVICGLTIKRTVTDGVLIAGDAAHMINPLSGGGIVNAMKAGRLAGRHAARAIGQGDTSAANLQAYHDEWMALLGDSHAKYYQLKETINNFDDDFFDRLARTINAIPLEKRSVARVMTSALVHHPSLVPIAAKLFMQEFC